MAIYKNVQLVIALGYTPEGPGYQLNLTLVSAIQNAREKSRVK